MAAQTDLHPILQALLFAFPDALEYDSDTSLTVVDRQYFARRLEQALPESNTCRTCHEVVVPARGAQCVECREKERQQALAARNPQAMPVQERAKPVKPRAAKPAVEPRPAPVPTPLALAPPVEPPAPPQEPREPEVEAVIVGGVEGAPVPHLPATATELERALSAGVPEALPVQLHPNVLELFGVDLDMAVAAMRAPKAVAIDVTNKQRQYPVLRFRRGDVCTVVGFKNLEQPAVLGVYVDAILAHDHHRTHAAGGGGSKQKTLGKPRTIDALVKRVEMLNVELGEPNSSNMAEATYDGQSLGKVQVAGVATRMDCESSWDRIQRKVHAIERRKVMEAG